MPLETLSKPKFVIENVVAQGMTRSVGWYTLDKISLRSKKKDQSQTPIREGEVDEFRRRMQPKDYSIVKHLAKTVAQI